MRSAAAGRRAEPARGLRGARLADPARRPRARRRRLQRPRRAAERYAQVVLARADTYATGARQALPVGRATRQARQSPGQQRVGRELRVDPAVRVCGLDRAGEADLVDQELPRLQVERAVVRGGAGLSARRARLRSRCAPARTISASPAARPEASFSRVSFSRFAHGCSLGGSSVRSVRATTARWSSSESGLSRSRASVDRQASR